MQRRGSCSKHRELLRDHVGACSFGPVFDAWNVFLDLLNILFSQISIAKYSQFRFLISKHLHSHSKLQGNPVGTVGKTAKGLVHIEILFQYHINSQRPSAIYKLHHSYGIHCEQEVSWRQSGQ
jgi:hypothetical protein